MTRKHFKAIAEDLRAYLKANPEAFNDLAFTTLVNDLMRTFEDMNPNFDSSRFISAVYD